MSNKIPKKKDRPGVDRYGRNELHHAAFKGDVQKVADLIKVKAGVNHQDDDGRTALHCAADNNHLEVVKLLLQENANPNLLDSHGNSPLWTATMSARGDFSVLRLLLAAGADPMHVNRHGRSPYNMAMTIRHGLEEVFRDVTNTTEG